MSVVNVARKRFHLGMADGREPLGFKRNRKSADAGKKVEEWDFRTFVASPSALDALAPLRL